MPTKLPRITVVTPSFNQAHFLEATILSVLGQGYANLEYIIMDGGSTDGSVEILKRYAPQLAYCQSGKDAGQAAAINAGFARATGEILCWLNSDDFLFPGVLQRVAARLQPRIQDPALIYGSCLFFRQSPSPSAKILTAKPYDRAQLRITDYLIQPSTFWTRHLWEKAGVLDETLTYTFDWEWLIRASEHAPFEAVHELLSAYRRHEAHKSGSGGSQRRDEILAVVRRHSSARTRAVYELACAHWPAVRAWTHLRRAFQRWHLPAPGLLARLTTPHLWNLPAGVTLHDLRVARSMLEDA